MKISNDVLAVLSSAVTDDNELRLVGQLDRKMYVKVNDILEAAGGKWNRKAKAHIFDGDAAERIDEIILTGEVDKPKDEFNYFPTPDKVVEIMLDLACIEPGMAVLEPSAGRGAIATKCRDEGALVECIEFNDANAAVLAAKGFEVVARDFLLVVPGCRKYDRVIMNPPFMKQADIKHVIHAYGFLKPVGGLLVSIMSASVTFRSNKLTTEFRDFVYSRGGTINNLPARSFKESGTMVNTVIVAIPS